jgi:hypothetical protein
MSENQVIIPDASKTLLRETLHRYCDFTEEKPQFRLNEVKKIGADKVMFIPNEIYIKARFMNRQKIKMKDEMGVVRVFIWDKKENLYFTKKKDKICVPHICGQLDSQVYRDFYKEKDINKADEAFTKSSIQARAENHTGNHHRNNFVKVPPRAIGQ